MVSPPIPFAPSFDWYQQRFQAILQGLPASQAVEHANRMVLNDCRPFARTEISGESEPFMLSIPVKGGNRILRCRQLSFNPEISGHGNWKHVHLGALNAGYGRQPFFSELMPGIEGVYRQKFDRLIDFNIAIHKALLTFMLCDISQENLKYHFREVTMERAKEVIEKIDLHLSLLDSLMRFGKETLLALLIANTKD